VINEPSDIPLSTKPMLLDRGLRNSTTFESIGPDSSSTSKFQVIVISIPLNYFFCLVTEKTEENERKFISFETHLNYDRVRVLALRAPEYRKSRIITIEAFPLAFEASGALGFCVA
jgi:hypothetical protein